MCLEGIVCEFERSPFALLQTNSPTLGIAYERICAVQKNINRHLPSIGHFLTEHSSYLRLLSLFNDFHVTTHHTWKIMSHNISLKDKVILWIVLRVLQSSHPMSLHASFSPLLQLPALASCFYTIKIDACIEFQHILLVYQRVDRNATTIPALHCTIATLSSSSLPLAYISLNEATCLLFSS